MYKQEVICDNCDSHYIVVTRSDENIVYCPFCAFEIKTLELDEDE